MGRNNTVLNVLRPFTVALTGGIASGKTLISNEFKSLGVPVIDTDIIAREIVEPGQSALNEIENSFGSSYIDPDGRLRRSALRLLIFSDKPARKKLESILHPKIKQYAAEAIAKVIAPYCMLVIPLLAEKDYVPEIDRILVVDVEAETQINRLMTRDGSNRLQATQILEAQLSREQRLELADDILDNSGSIEKARNAVKLLHEKYLKLALQHSANHQHT